MDKSNEKGKTRNRYAKLQPLVNRINELQALTPASNSFNYHPAVQHDKHNIDSHTYQLQNDFGNLAPAKCTETQVIKNPINTELQNLKMPAALFDQSALSQATNAVTPTKQRKYKHKNREKIHRTSSLDLKAKLLNILYCVLHIMCSPVVFFAKVFLTLASSLASVLYNIFKLSLPRGKNSSQEQNGPQSVEANREIWSRLPTNSLREKQAPDLNKLLIKRSSDRHPGNGFVSSGVMSSNCLSNKYLRSFLDYRDCRKRVARQYQDSISVAGEKMFFSGNSAFKGSRTVFNSKRLHMDSKNSSHKSHLRLLMKNRNPHSSGASEFSEAQLPRIFATNQPSAIDKQTDLKTDHKFNGHKQSSATLLTNFSKKRSEKFKPYAFTALPLRPTLQKKSPTENERTCEEMSKECNCALPVDLQSNSAALDSQNGDSQPIVEPNYQFTKKLEPYINIDEDLSQMRQLTNAASVRIKLDQYNAQKLVPKSDVASSSLQSGLDLGAVNNEGTDSGSSKTVSELKEAAQRTGCKKQIGTSESPSLSSPAWDLSQSREIPRNCEDEKRTNGSGDRIKTIKNGESRTAEFIKPVDAKSKWMEMKKKFYGKDYVASKDQPQKSEAQNLSRITSVSQLPAHKVFQYNMQVGRARQMGTKPPLPQDIFLEKKTTSPCLETLQNCSTGFNLRRNDPHLLKSAISTSRCLSHTQSLSQWPVDLAHPSRDKKYCSAEQKPKPKPRTGRDSKVTTMGFGTAHLPRRPATRTNPSVSSSNVRDDQILQNEVRLLDWPSQEKNTTGILSRENASMCDEYAEKIDSLISFCRYPFSVPRESMD